MRKYVFILLAACSVPAQAQDSGIGQPSLGQPVGSPSVQADAGFQAGVPGIETIAAEDVVPAAQLDTTLAELENVHAQNYHALAAVLEKVPADVRPTIQQAMERSRQGWQRANENRQKHAADRQARAASRASKSQGRGNSFGHAQAREQSQMHGQGQMRDQGQGRQSGVPAQMTSGANTSNANVANFAYPQTQPATVSGATSSPATGKGSNAAASRGQSGGRGQGQGRGR